MLGEFVTARPEVGACDLGPVTVLLNYRTGATQTLTGYGAAWWTQLAETGLVGTMFAPDITRQLVTKLLNEGFLTLVDQPRPWAAPRHGVPITASWGTDEAQAGTPAGTPATVPMLGALVAGFGLSLVLIAEAAGRKQRRMLRILTLLHWASKLGQRPAGESETAAAVAAIRAVTRPIPARVACLEESAAAFVALALTGRQARWCHGVAADPIRLHAWLETHNGQSPAEPPATSRYTALRTVPAKSRSCL